MSAEISVLHQEDPENATAWQLRVLDGEQSGANVVLHPARYLIGSGEGCDIVLTGTDIEGKHLEAFFADGRFSLLRAFAPVFVDGEVASQFPVDLDAGRIVTLGSVSLSFGKEDEDAPDADAVKAIYDKIEAAKTLPPAGKSATAAQQKISMPGRKAILAGLAMLGIFAGAGVAVWDAPLPASLPVPSAPVTAEEREPLRSRLNLELRKNPAYANVRVETNANGDTRLVGYVEESNALAALRSLTRQERVPLRVDSLEQTRAILSQLLDSQVGATQYELSGTPDGLHLRIFGIVNTPATVQSFEEKLRRELPSITSIESNIESWDAVQSSLDVFHDSKPQYSEVSSELRDSMLVLSGTILGDYAQEWRDGLNGVLSTLPEHLVIHDEVVVAPVLNAAVESVLIGAEAAVRLSFSEGSEVRRELYGVGARLPNGLEITAIDRYRIMLSDGIDSFVMPIAI